MATANQATCSLPSDFPSRLDPFLVKELRLALRHRWFLGSFLFVHVMMLLAVSLEWLSLRRTETAPSSANWNAYAVLGRNAFWLAAHVMMGLVLPLRGFESLQEELRGRNAELLLVAGLSRWRIMRGKWISQMVLAMLVLANFLPYLVVRYFFGGFNFSSNLVHLFAVVTGSVAMNGLVLGISGYASYITRFVLLAVAFLNGLAMVIAVTSVVSFTEFHGFELLVAVFVSLGAFAYAVLLCLVGLQLGRAHLKKCLLPWENSPTRDMVVLLVMLPLIVLVGSLMTLGWGGVLVMGVLIIIMIKHDPTSQSG